jgi:hypothetical protein
MSEFKIRLLLIVAAIVSVSFAAESKPIDSTNKLKSERLEVREKAAEAIRQERAELIRELIKLAGQKVEPLPSSDPRFTEYPWHDSKHLAILLLGDLRAREAIEVLLENLSYKNPRSLVSGAYLERGGWYPSVEALSKIGMPAIVPTIGKLATYEQDGLGRQLCCWVINKVLGPRLGKLRIEIAIEETRDATAKKNLEAALGYFKTPEEKAAEERARRKEQNKADSPK